MKKRSYLLDCAQDLKDAVVFERSRGTTKNVMIGIRIPKALLGDQKPKTMLVTITLDPEVK